MREAFESLNREIEFRLPGDLRLQTSFEVYRGRRVKGN